MDTAKPEILLNSYEAEHTASKYLFSTEGTEIGEGGRNLTKGLFYSFIAVAVGEAVYLMRTSSNLHCCVTRVIMQRYPTHSEELLK